MAYELGIDLNKNNALISVAVPGESEPVTLSMTEDENAYVIPYSMARLNDGRWEIGLRAANAEDDVDIRIDDVLERALFGKSVAMDARKAPASELLGIFLQNICAYARVRYGFDVSDRAVITVPVVDGRMLALFDEIKGVLPANDVLIRDHKETFASYVMAQSPGLYEKAVFLYDFDGKDMTNLIMTRDTKFRPVVVKVKEDVNKGFGERIINVKKNSTQLDMDFSQMLKEDFEYMDASTVFLTGDGFESKWAKDSIQIICRGRRAFGGQNLFSKGACYLAKEIDKQDKSYVYLGESKTKANVCLEINENGKSGLLDLLSAGENWYETGATHRIVMGEGDELRILLVSPDMKHKDERTLTLSNLPKRPEGAASLLISARALAEDTYVLTIKDLGFGELFPSSGKEWDYKITL